ncbi:rhodanese-like domain-containing protein [Myroides sp. JBRI-B21084]|uniref:rhodanese-like domain-containing protein n=1 Tax=Myroides sp. JBRI-B21084 TaxID=3119977 RepID=UPI0026E11B98|nr:rhodanese-like domain-containing protein [Paenimyroides cloacae]WKW46559.1 rhodanese-like domain-containing protein [Paenimyroides cloacae]
MFQFIKNLVDSNDSNLKEVLSSSNVFLVDVRTPEEFASGSAKKAVNIPLNQIVDQINSFKNKNNIVVFCRSGNRSNMAKNILKQNGIANVTNGGSLQNVLKNINF